MNKLLTNIPGGMPFRLNDLEFLQNTYNNVINSLINILGERTAQGFIVGGCDIVDVNGQYQYTEGMIFLYNELFQVDAGVLVKGTGTLYWVIDESYDSNGEKVFADGETHNTYLIRKMKLIQSDTPPDSSTYVTVTESRMFDYMISNLGLSNMLNAWKSKDVSASNVVLNGASFSAVSGNFRYNFTGKTVMMNFSFSIQIDSIADPGATIEIDIGENWSIKKDTLALIQNTEAVSNSRSDLLYVVSVKSGNKKIYINNIEGVQIAVDQHAFVGQIIFEIE